MEAEERVEDADAKREENAEEEALTDYERFIQEELEESLSVVTAEKIPEEPKVIRELPKPAPVPREKANRKRPVRPVPKREVREVTAAVREETREDVISPGEERAPEVVNGACDETCPLVKEQKGEQLAYFQEETSILFAPEVLILPRWKAACTMRARDILHLLEMKILFPRYRTHRAQIEGTAEGRRSLLSDERHQLFRGRVHVLSGLHGVQFEQGPVCQKHIRVSHIVRGGTEAVLRAGRLGNAKPRLIVQSHSPSITYM